MVNNNVDWRKVLVKIAGNISLTELNLNILEELHARAANE